MGESTVQNGKIILFILIKYVSVFKYILNGALKKLIASIEIGKVSEKEYKSTFPLWKNFQKLQDYVNVLLIPITVNFAEENRHLLIYTNPKNFKDYWYVGVKVDDTGKIEKFRFGPITPDWNALIWPEVIGGFSNPS